MTNEQKNVPELRFPGFEGEWVEKRLGNISKSAMYGIGASAVDFDFQNVYIRITDIDENSRKLKRQNFTSPNEINEKYLVKKNDILFARTGASTGKSYIHRGFSSNYNYYFAGFLIKFEINENNISSFVYQKTLTNKYLNWVSVMSVRSGQPGINSEEYSKLPIFLPSKFEQQKIGDFFSKLDKQIELEEKKLELLEQQKKGYMQKIFSQELRFKDENGKNYTKWKIERLGNLINEISEKTISNNQYSLLSSTKNGLLSQEEYFKKQIGSKNNIGYKILRLNQLVISPQNLWLGNININQRFDIGIVSPSYRIYNLSRHFNINFAKDLLKSSRYVYEYAQASEQGASIVRRNLNLNLFYSIKVFLPSIEEQEKIGEFLSNLDSFIEKQSDKVELLKLRKQGLLQKMFI